MPETSKEDRVTSYFNESEDVLLRSFKGWEEDIPHVGEIGGIRERRVMDLILKILPKKFGLGRGHIIDRFGNISRQIDIVVFDQQNGFSLPRDDYYSLFPCECVSATIEVKTILTASDGDSPAGSIYECLENTSSIKRLDRNDLGEIRCFCFAYRTSWKEKFGLSTVEWFENLAKKYDKRIPEEIFILEDKLVLSGINDPTGLNRKGVLTHIYEQASLIKFLSSIMYGVENTKTRSPNLWSEYVAFEKGKPIARIRRADSEI